MVSELGWRQNQADSSSTDAEQKAASVYLHNHLISEPLGMGEPNHTFGRGKRLLNKHDYAHVFNQAQYKSSAGNFLLLAQPSLTSSSRLGLVVAKKHIKKAVGRNNVKRHARELFRQQKASTLPLDMVLLSRTGAGQLDSSEIRQQLDRAFKKIIAQASQSLNQHLE
jgi:ribonuclease P protein component